MNYHILLFLSVFLLNAVPACQDPDLTEQVSDKELKLTLKQEEKIKTDNAFTFKLLEKVLPHLAADENAMLSPLGVNLALRMVANGADGETRNEIDRALNADNYSEDFLNDYYNKLITTLPDLDSNIEFDIANSIWYKKEFEVLPGFLKENKDYYLATVQALNFNDPRSISTINEWVNSKTRGKIPTIIDKIDSDTRMYLMNAIYFKGAWSMPFNKEKTIDKEFHTTKGIVNALFMGDNASYLFIEKNDFQAVKLPYGDSTYSLTAVLPMMGTSPSVLLSQLSIEGRWEQLQMEFKARPIKLAFPKFSFSYENTLNDELEKLGIKTAFTRMADFSRIEESGKLSISEVKHKTFLEVNEQGTEAAAVTSIGMVVTSMPQYYPVEFNRPFLFFIQEESSGLIMFAGQINHPE